IVKTGVICPYRSMEVVSLSKSFGFATLVWAYRRSKLPRSTSTGLIAVCPMPSRVSHSRIKRYLVISLQSLIPILISRSTPWNETYFHVYRVHLCNPSRGERNELIDSGNDRAFTS